MVKEDLHIELDLHKISDLENALVEKQAIVKSLGGEKRTAFLMNSTSIKAIKDLN
jgi:hypothetical protein